jgi:hypothetical protein
MSKKRKYIFIMSKNHYVKNKRRKKGKKIFIMSKKEKKILHHDIGLCKSQRDTIGLNVSAFCLDT